ncbi:MAG: cytochrome c3 family protein [Bacteroidales bacterium]|nr:cytochrome c3 family protein [Bacteroidales bacterium]
MSSTNILAQLTKPYLHNVYAYNLEHDAAEDPLVLSMHVECEDCHNPHAVSNTPALAPAANGFLTGISGVDQSGNPVDPIQYAYELCYRCHADSPAKPTSLTTRLIEQNNVILEFDPANPSHHALTSAGANPNVPSLIAPLSESSMIYCTDCHACHDPHGISHNQGNSTNHAHLINFDRSMVSPANNGLLQFESLGVFSGRCYLNCHGQNHMGFAFEY